MNQNFFETCRTVAETKSLYRFLAKEYHPDHKPLAEKDRYNAIMATVNEQYHSKLKSLNGEKTLNRETGKVYEYKYSQEQEQLVMDMVCRVLAYDFPPHITVSIVGLWIWIEGITQHDKDMIAHLKNCKMTVGEKSYWFFPNKYRDYTWQCNLSGWRGRKSSQSSETIKGYYGAKEVKRSDSSNIE